MISVITWDAAFRESYHTVDFFNNQNLDKNLFEFIWAEFYSTINLELEKKIQEMENGRIFCFGGEGKWHLGQCLNAAIRQSSGDLIVIPDGDIVVEEDFLKEVKKCHERYPKLVLYFRRWDELKPDSIRKKVSLSTLRNICNLMNPINYGGCLTLSRKIFNHVNGYEEHELFSEAGANGMELYIRLKNAGYPIMWHPTHKIYHPWHLGTGPQDPEYQKKIDLQNWLINERNLRVTYMAGSNATESSIQTHRNKPPSPYNKLTAIQKFKNFILDLPKN